MLEIEKVFFEEDQKKELSGFKKRIQGGKFKDIFGVPYTDRGAAEAVLEKAEGLRTITSANFDNLSPDAQTRAQEVSDNALTKLVKVNEVASRFGFSTVRKPEPQDE